MLASEPLKTRRVPKESVRGARLSGGMKLPVQSGSGAELAKMSRLRD